jgi:hypothetical protein
MGSEVAVPAGWHFADLSALTTAPSRTRPSRRGNTDARGFDEVS